MNPHGLARAKHVLRRIGVVHQRLKERELARAVLNRHLSKVSAKPTKSAVKKIEMMVDEVLRKERDLMKSGMADSHRVDYLHEKLLTLNRDYKTVKQQLAAMQEKLSGYEELKRVQAKKQKALEKKMMKATPSTISSAAEKKLRAFEQKLLELKASGKVSKKTLQTLEKKIKELKKL